ncbi:STAT1 protein, partial [Gymnorhina tibicen]|nr:STAT1 protein [Gymnorhina tibicen]
QSRGPAGSTQDRAGAEGPPGAAGTEQEQRDPLEHPGPSRSRGTPGSSRDRAGAEGPPGAAGAEAEQRDPRHACAGTCGAEVPSWDTRVFLVLWSCCGRGGTRAASDPCPPSMAQWQEVQSLANTHLEQVHQLYAGSALPMAVRQCLAAWIESQNWRQAAEPLSSHARMLFHSLLVLLGERLGSLGSGHEDFMLKHNLRKAHRDLQVGF